MTSVSPRYRTADLVVQRDAHWTDEVLMWTFFLCLGVVVVLLGLGGLVLFAMSMGGADFIVLPIAVIVLGAVIIVAAATARTG